MSGIQSPQRHSEASLPQPSQGTASRTLFSIPPAIPFDSMSSITKMRPSSGTIFLSFFGAFFAAASASAARRADRAAAFHAE